MKMKNASQLLIVLLLVSMLCCKKDKPPEKIFIDCELQYTQTKFLQQGDSIVVPKCGGQPPSGNAGKLDSISFTYISPDSYGSCPACYKLQFMNRASSYTTTITIGNKSTYISNQIGGMKYKIEKVTSEGIEFNVMYNYK